MQQFAPCPDSPNCVNSMEPNTKAFVEPYVVNPENNNLFMEKLANAIDSLPRTKIIISLDNYLHVEFKTFLGFVDDVEFLYSKDKAKLDFRSASRVGYSDFGKNKKRYLLVKEKLVEKNLIK